MRRAFLCEVPVACLAAIALGAPAARAATEKEAPPTSEDGAPSPVEDGAGGENGPVEEEEVGEERFLTGIDFSYWGGPGQDTYGPGLTWGLVLVPRHLELGLTVGAMLGSTTYSIPLELRFEVPFWVNRWLAPYAAIGPTVLFDQRGGDWEHGFAASGVVGIQVKPPGFHWSVRLSGDYSLRFWRELENVAGGSIGFLYRF